MLKKHEKQLKKKNTTGIEISKEIFNLFLMIVYSILHLYFNKFLYFAIFFLKLCQFICFRSKRSFILPSFIKI